MAKVKVGKSIENVTSLWRYTALDKLVHTLDTGLLYFTPVATFKDSDPFEGYTPKVAFEAMSSIIHGHNKEFGAVFNEVKKLELKRSYPNPIHPIQQKRIDLIQHTIDTTGTFLKETYLNGLNAVTVNCWHSNKFESEAMWRLYSDSGKGVAIKTSVESLKKSLESVEQDILVQLGMVKYLDFFDENLSPKDCVVDGHLSPLLKRKSFIHENELRMFVVNSDPKNPKKKFQPEPNLVQCNALDLIEQIYISPYAKEPFISSVLAICKRFGIKENKILKSHLLEGHLGLLEIFDNKKA